MTQPEQPVETRCPFANCSHQPGELLAQQLIDHHSREGIAHKLAHAIETIRQLKRTS